MTLHEVNFDGLVGPTHNYAGLSPGNLASTGHAGRVSNPRAAVLQGIEKMRFVAGLGIRQGVLPPHERPLLPFFRSLGFSGADEHVLAEVAARAPQLLKVGASASAMWTANAATVAPGPDTRDGRLHVVPANLTAMPHRALEAATTTRVLRAIFADPGRFAVHDPLPGSPLFSDEGAANHTRLAAGQMSLHIFGYGRVDHRPDPAGPAHNPARQSQVASASVARLLQLPDERVLLARQHPAGIDAGAFHTDVLAVGCEDVFLVHAHAFTQPDALFDQARRRLGADIHVVFAAEAELPAADAVAAYPFNSQLLPTPTGLQIVAPAESERTPTARAYLERAAADCPRITGLHFRDVNQSMNNGGGPACLRLRVPLTDDDIAHLGARVMLDEDGFVALEDWARRHYRDRLQAADLADPTLWRDNLRALDELTGLLALGAVYPFQRAGGDAARDEVR